MPNSPAPDIFNAARSEHDAVLAALSTRESTKHFAHAAVSVVSSMTLGGTSTKLWWDFWETAPELASSFLGFTGLLLAYAAARVVLGLRVNRRERVQLGRLRELRKTLGVDAPASLTQQTS